MKKAIVLFSGGQDSATCLFWALKNYDHVETIGFDYAQRHKIELNCAKWQADYFECKSHRIFKLDFFGGSSLTDNINVPKNENGEMIIRHSKETPRYGFFSGYLNKLEETEKSWRNGWFHTGDLCRKDDEGYIFFMDRVKDYIRRRGENISSFEVENMVSSHPKIKEAAAIAVKVDEEGRYSEDEVMIIVVKEEGENLDPKEIIEFLKPIMPKFMIPRFIKFRDFLPKTPTNRVQKAKLREEGVTSDTWDSLNS